MSVNSVNRKDNEMHIYCGKIKLNILNCGTFKLDGGAMFGVVPKTIWNKTNPADEMNRILLGMNPLLIESGNRKVLVDAGIGDKFNDKYRQIYCISNDANHICDELKKINVTPDEVTDIIITHLHFDHCGGFTKYADAGVSELMFKNAEIYLQKKHYEAAGAPTERDRASFIKDDIQPIFDSPRLKLLDGDTADVIPGISVKVSNGHTPALQTIKINDSGQSVYYLSDLTPTSSHIPIPYVMGYDLYPVTMVAEKRKMFDDIIAENAIAIFEHDPFWPVYKINKNEKGYFGVKHQI